VKKMATLTILGKINTNMEFIQPLNSIKGSITRTLKRIGDVDTECSFIVDWSFWHKLSVKVQQRSKFVVFSETTDWMEDVWSTSCGLSLISSPLFGSSELVVVGGGDHIKRVVDAIGPMATCPKIITVPCTLTSKGSFCMLGPDSVYYRDVTTNDDEKVQVYLN